MAEEHVYIAIDLKSFYASVECVERGLNPLTARLVVADASRTQKTICLAVSPELKKYGIPGRPRLFEVVQKAGQAGVDYIVAPPRMALYMEYSTRIYKIYLRYVAPEDIHIYSVDEVFMDITSYLKNYNMTARELTMKIIQEVLRETGITATAGIGTNLYLCKIAMDIVAKHIVPDENGVRIAELDEMSYRRLLWNHRPIQDFWRVGAGYAKKLANIGLYTMGDVARCSVGKEDEFHNEDLLYKIFGVNAELLIDHAWGWEPCKIEDIKKYKPATNSICSGQVLKEPYSYEKASVVIREMADMMALDLVDKCMVTNQLVITVGYDIENLHNPDIRDKYTGEITSDHYGRKVPKHAHGSVNLDSYTSSSKTIVDAAVKLFDRIINKDLLIRRLNLSVNQVVSEDKVIDNKEYEQLDLFSDFLNKDTNEKEKKLQHAVLDIKKKYGKNALIKGVNMREGSTAVERNSQIGGHRA